jgi:hypothetical protein
MGTSSCELPIRVLSVRRITEFEGEAVLTHSDPKFVVDVLIEDSKSSFCHPSGVVLTVHSVVTLAIHSVWKLFLEGESDIAGERYTLKIDMTEEEGTRRYSVRLA